MSKFIESLCVIQGDDDSKAGRFEATLYENGTVELDMDDGEASLGNTYDLVEVERIHAALGHLLWIAKHKDDE